MRPVTTNTLNLNKSWFMVFTCRCTFLFFMLGLQQPASCINNHGCFLILLTSLHWFWIVTSIRVLTINNPAELHNSDFFRSKKEQTYSCMLAYTLSREFNQTTKPSARVLFYLIEQYEFKYVTFRWHVGNFRGFTWWCYPRPLCLHQSDGGGSFPDVKLAGTYPQIALACQWAPIKSPKLQYRIPITTYLFGVARKRKKTYAWLHGLRSSMTTAARRAKT